jgi:hypothetical protein
MSQIIRFKTAPSCVPFKNTLNLYSNRDYTISEVPQKYSGYTMLYGEAGGTLSVTVFHPTEVFFAKAPGVAVEIPKGLTKTEDKVRVKTNKAEFYDVYTGTITESLTIQNRYCILALKP